MELVRTRFVVVGRTVKDMHESAFEMLRNQGGDELDVADWTIDVFETLPLTMDGTMWQANVEAHWTLPAGHSGTRETRREEVQPSAPVLKQQWEEGGRSHGR